MIAWAFATVCIQPALVEEWFFRGIAWKTFRDHMGPHGTVWVIAIMFGLAHVGAFLSVPVLILLGALLGYARLYSGGSRSRSCCTSFTILPAVCGTRGNDRSHLSRRERSPLVPAFWDLLTLVLVVPALLESNPHWGLAAVLPGSSSSARPCRSGGE